MGIYLFKKSALLEALDNDLVDFGRDVIPGALDRFRVQAHFFRGYWRDIGTIGTFFAAHMDLVAKDPQFTFHDPEWRIYTRPRYLPGARLHSCRFDRVLLADGTRIEDSQVEQSVVGLRSSVRGATVRRSLLMGVDSHYPEAPAGAPSVGIGPGTVIENAIIDKNPRIGRDVRIVNVNGLEEADGDDWTIRDGIVVIPKNAVIPDGTVI
jgi:glucose-1-phosphate adenylyltransferase